MSSPTPYYQNDRGITLYNADALELLPQLEAGSVDCIFTDPPYGHNNNNGDLIHHLDVALGRAPSLEAPRPIANDGPEANTLFQRMLPEWQRVLAVGGGVLCCCCGGGGGPDPQFARWSLWLDEVFDFVQMIVWDKGKIGLGWRYRRSYETVLVAKKKGAKMRWFDDSHKVENIIRHIGKIIPRKTDHPTPKPVALVEHFLKLHTQEGHLVLDPFVGGGATLVAAQNLGRRAIGVELDEYWCEHTARRLEGLPTLARAA